MNNNKNEFLELRRSIYKYQELASQFGIADIFQDNGGKLLEVLVMTGLQNLPDRQGNDAIDDHGNEYEIKTINSKLTRSVSTHHHLNLQILDKYRKAIWLFAVYEDLKLIQIYKVNPEDLENYFSAWEGRIIATSSALNNPKIALNHIKKVGTTMI
ncbi:hypothetical protein [Vibrio owensii]|uniref:hypothetical protein n=1 Tax=Vibrio harveyi group TaxID=717610 RepID=UPI003CC5499A